MTALVNLRASDKQKILEKLAHKAGLALDFDPVALLSALLRREELGSTGLGGGVALPHARVPGVKAPYALLAILAAPVLFDAVDDRPVDIVMLLVLPSPFETDGLKALACCARRLRDPGITAALRRAPDEATVRLVFAGQNG